MIGTLVDQYRLLKIIGQGGMGVVYEAKHEKTDARVAVKVVRGKTVDGKSSERFLLEAKAIAQIDHPGLVKVLDYRTLTDSTTYIVMELLQGETLAARLESLRESKKQMSSECYMEFGRQIANALCAAHNHGIAHCDLKPENIFLVKNNLMKLGEQIKILDFGIAKFLRGGPRITTQQDQILGSPPYMAPEQWDGRSKVTEKVDVYALGIIFYEMISSQPPFVAESGSAYFGLHATAKPNPLRKVVPSVSDHLASLVHRMLAKKAAERPSAADVFEYLDSLPPDIAVFRWLRRHTYAVAGTFTAMVVLGAVLSVIVWVQWFHVSTGPPNLPKPAGPGEVGQLSTPLPAVDGSAPTPRPPTDADTGSKGPGSPVTPPVNRPAEAGGASAGQTKNKGKKNVPRRKSDPVKSSPATPTVSPKKEGIVHTEPEPV